MSDTPLRVLLASGGSGGHIFPGIHIAAALREQGPAEITFVGVGRPVEERIVGNAGYELRTIRTVGLKGRGVRGAIQFLCSIPKAFATTWQLFSEKKPQVVVATGGYAGFFPLVVAFLRGVPRWLHEAERKPGLANSVLSFIASKTSIAFKDARMPFWADTVFTGHPVRASLKSVRREEAPATIKHVLIVGGSQGARSLDEAAGTLAPLFARHGIEVWHQCRSGNEKAVQGAYQSAAVSARVASFIDEMDEAYNWSDIIIARSGAGTVSELAVVNRPTIFVPFPFSQGNHQEANARVLVDASKAQLVLEGAGFSERLQAACAALLETELFYAMSSTPYTPPALGAAAAIARGVRTLATGG